MITIPLLSHIIGAVTILFLGIIVYFHDKKSVTNNVLFLHTFTIAFWTISNYFSITTTGSDALFWIRLVIFFAVPHVFLFWFFIYVFPLQKIKVKPFQVILYFLLFIIAGYIALSPYGFNGVKIENGNISPTPGALMPLFMAIIIS